MCIPRPFSCQDWLHTLLRARAGVAARPMFGCPAFFVKRRMFACVVNGAIGLKLPAPRVRALIAAGAHPFTPHGRAPMREWLEIHLEETDLAEAEALVLEAAAFVERAA